MSTCTILCFLSLCLCFLVWGLDVFAMEGSGVFGFFQERKEIVGFDMQTPLRQDEPRNTRCLLSVTWTQFFFFLEDRKSDLILEVQTFSLPRQSLCVSERGVSTAVFLSVSLWLPLMQFSGRVPVQSRPPYVVRSHKGGSLYKVPCIQPTIRLRLLYGEGQWSLCMEPPYGGTLYGGRGHCIEPQVWSPP